MTQTPLTRLNLAGFSPKKARLIRKMEDHGWTGRISSNGHAIMRCPDGETTTSVSPKMGSGRGLLNDEATFKKWMREHGEQSAAVAARIRDENDRQAALHDLFPDDFPAVDTVSRGQMPAIVAVTPDEDGEVTVTTATFVQRTEVTPEPAPEPEPAPVKVPVCCTEPGCNRVFATLQGMSVHRITHRAVACRYCGRTMQPNGMGKHEKTHLEELTDPEALLREVYRLRTTLAEARTEASAWERMADEAEERYVALQAVNQRAIAALLGE